MRLLFENWRGYLKEGVIDAEFRFLQKAARDNGEILEYEEKDGEHIVTFWKPAHRVDPYEEFKGEELQSIWDTSKSFFRETFSATMRTKEDAMEYAKDMVEVLQDVTREEDDYEESLRRRYDQEEAAARREGPSTPRSSEEIAALWGDDDEEGW